MIIRIEEWLDDEQPSQITVKTYCSCGAQHTTFRLTIRGMNQLIEEGQRRFIAEEPHDYLANGRWLADHLLCSFDGPGAEFPLPPETAAKKVRVEMNANHPSNKRRYTPDYQSSVDVIE